MRANFHRVEGWAECNAIRVKPSPSGDSIFPLCRALVEAGTPDAPLECYDEHGAHCFTVDLISRGARSAYSETASGLRIGRWAPLLPGTFQKPKIGIRHSGKGMVSA